MANEYLKRTPTSTGNRKVHTASFWAKINAIDSSYRTFFSCGGESPAARTEYGLDNNDYFNMGINDDGSQWHSYISSAKGRDCGNWMHFCISVDSTRSDGKERIKYWINGKFIETTVANELNVNADTPVNDTVSQLIGKYVSAGQYSRTEFSDFFLVDGQALTPDVFGFYKEGKGYISAGSTQATDFRNGQWVPRKPSNIIQEINDNGGFGVNGFYLPMNDSSNFGADFHCPPNSIIKLKGENLPQPRNGAPETTDAYVSQLREDPYAANLVLALPFVSGGLCTNGTNSGINTGFGDYSTSIKGSGTLKVGVITASSNLSIANTAAYYGSAALTDSSNYISFDDSSDFDIGLSNEPFTWETWFNLTTTSTSTSLGVTRGGGVAGWNGTNGHQYQPFYYSVDNKLYFQYWTGATLVSLTSPASIITTNQWNHMAVVYDTKSNLTMYVNGVAVAIQASTTFGKPSSSNITRVGVSAANDIAAAGYQQDVRLYKGVAKYKGGFDVPKPYTPVGIATWRAVLDTTANNYATWNPLDVYQNAGTGGPATLSSGNLITGSNDNKSTHSNFGVTSGKWYYESMFSQGINNSDGLGVVAQYEKGYNGTSNGGYYILYRDNGGLFIGNGTSRYDPPAGTYRSWGPYDVISVGIDVDNREVIFFNKGIEELRYPFPSHVADGAVWMPALLNRQAGYIYTNFGQNPTFSGNTTPGTFTDSNGKGLFKYQPPTGFLALCEDNLPRPVIEDPGEHFKTVLWTGDGTSSRSITGIGFTPDLVWMKIRAGTIQDNQLYDSVRGAGGGKCLATNTTATEGTVNSFPDSDYGYLSSFDSSGFSINDGAVATTGGYVNYSGRTYAAWCWKAGNGTQTNTDGSITSQVSVNQDAGFSIVSYTGNNTDGATIGHGLGKKPSMIIVKERNGTSGWFVYHKFPGATKYLTLNATTGITTETGAGSWFFGTEPTSSVFTVGANGATNENNMPIIAYCWAEIEGFSKFGSYVGNGNADGPFVYCGFKPAWLMVKRVDSGSSENWLIDNSSSSPTNPIDKWLYSNLSNVEGGGVVHMDFLSNGFKNRFNGADTNSSGGTYIFAAFAESPINYSNAK